MCRNVAVYLFLIFFCISIFDKILAQDLPAAKMADRLLLEINNHSFSQCQMEAFYLVKKIYFEKVKVPAQILERPSESWWQTALEEYRQDMLVLTEAQRLGRFQPNQDSIQELNKIVQKYIPTNDKWRNNFILEASSDLLQVEEFKRNKDKSIEVAKKHSKELWSQVLDKQYVSRFYEGAKNYLQLAENVEQK